MRRTSRTLGGALLGALSVSASASPPDAVLPPRAHRAERAPRDLAREHFADVALAQVRGFDPAWEPTQRDCAGLFRFALREAHRRAAPERLARALFVDEAGRATDFADARTLVQANLAPLGRGDDARRALQSGDVLAYRHERPEGEVWHLMLVVVPRGAPLSEVRVVYHPGTAGEPVRLARLATLETDAPLEWQPNTANSSFLGFYRFREWTP